jgi:signal transduction histidine kinase
VSAAWRRRGVGGLLALILVFGAVDYLNLAGEIGQPFGGFYANWIGSLRRWQVDAVTPPWWSGLARAGLHYQDTLLVLEGHPYGDNARQLFAAGPPAGRDSVSLTIERNGRALEVNLPLSTFTLGHFLDLNLADLLDGLGLWLMALAVYRTRPDAPLNQLFALTAGLAASSIWSSLPDLFPESTTLAHALHWVWIAATPFANVMIIHLALVFPEPTRQIPVRYLRVLYIGAGLMVLTQALVAVVPGSGADFLSELSYRIVGSLIGLSVSLYIGRLLYLVFWPGRAASRRIRRQAAFLLSGLILLLPYILVVVLRTSGHNSPAFFWNGLDVRYLVLAVPLTFAFVILRYQTSQSTHPLLVIVFILSGSALLASAGAWLIERLEPRWFDALTWSPFVPLFLAAFISALFWSSQSSWKGIFSRLFQWERRSYSAARQFGQQVVGQANLPKLPETIAVALVAKMELESAAVWLWDEVEKSFSLAGQAGEWKSSPVNKLTPDGGLTSYPMRLSESTLTPDWLTPARTPGQLEVVIPLMTSGQPVGLLGLGKRWDEEIFDARDLEILDLIAQQAALFLLTAMQIEQLRQVPHQISTAQEHERFAIAQELHDTVQQFLGRLPFYLEVGRRAVRADPGEAESLLQRTIADVERAARSLRLICNNLAPLQLETNLTGPLSLLIEHFRSRTGLEVEVAFSPEVDAHLSLDARHALYRVIQQALDNVAEHAQAKRATTTLTVEAGRIGFTVVDDGIGFAEGQRTPSEAPNGFGLKSMPARITALGGEFEIRSRLGGGTQVSGWLPASAP